MKAVFSGLRQSCSLPARDKTLRYLAFILMFLGLFAAQALAQQSTITGAVTDPTGAAVANATVTLTHVETGQDYKLTTNEVGQYLAPPLQIGHYTAKVEAKGFKTVTQKDILLQVGDRSRLDFKLEVGSATEQVTVEATGVQVQSDTGEVSGLITGQQMTALASNGRSIYGLVNMQPGASSLQGDFQVPTPVGGDANVSFNGSRPGHNIYLMDGGENLDRGGAGTFSVMPSMDAIAEFRVLSSNYSAEYGLSSAATMTTVLKSGTKSLHASAWEFTRNDALDARYFFNRKPDKARMLRFHTYGFNIGGPVQFHKDSNPNTFFFYNMEWRSLIQGDNLNRQVPLPSTYGGNFAGSGITPYVPCASKLSAAQQARFTAQGLAFSTCAADGTVTTASPMTSIPSALLDANAQSLLAAGIFPAPTSGNKFQGGNNAPTKVREEIVRMDHRFNDKFSIFGHFVAEQIMQTFGTTMWSGDNVPTIGNTFGNPSYSGVVHATHMINSTMLNEIAFNYNGNRIAILPIGLVAAPSSFTFNRLFTGPNALDRIPIINLGGSTGAQYSANWTPWNNVADDYQIRDDFSWTRGSHQLKFGGSWALYKKTQSLFASTQGNFTFDGTYTGNDFADFLLGYAQQYQESAVQDSGQWNNQSWALYAQDNWRVNNRLTLNLGLRWDGIPHTYEANNRYSNFFPSMYVPGNAPIFNSDGSISSSTPGLSTSPNPVLAGYSFYTNGMGISGQPGVPHGMVNNHWWNFGPRIGFAWDLTGKNKTLIRGGFGTMFERIQGNDMYNGGTNVPFSMNATVKNVMLANPKTGVGTGTTLVVPPLPILISDITGQAVDNYKNTTSYQYSIGVQHALAEQTVLTVSYVGNQMRHLSYFQNINVPNQSLIPSLLAGTTLYRDAVPYKGYNSIQLANNGGNGHYNSLQVDLRSQLGKDLTLQAGYTYSKAVDPANGNGNGYDLNAVSNPYLGWRYDQGPSFFDRPNVLFVNYVWSMPFLKGSSNKVAKAVLGGWELSGVVSASSGAPVNLVINGDPVAGLIPNTANRPDQVGDIQYTKRWVVTGYSGGLPVYGYQWFNPSAFALPASGTWGNAPHNALRGPGRFNVNTALFKTFSFTERLKLQLRAETFNTLNHTQFRANGQSGGLNNNFNAGGEFGTITSAYDPRSMQLGLKVIF